MDSYYQRWIEEEKNWMKRYRKKLLRKNLLVVYPMILGILILLFGGSMLATGGGLRQAGSMALAGVIMGAIICGIVQLCFMAGVSSKRMVKHLKKAMKRIGINEAEQEKLGREMLEAEKDPIRNLDFEMVGPNSNHTPASFTVTPHYVCLKGGSPLVILVRLSDVAKILANAEEKVLTTRSARMRATYRYILHTIGFFYRNRAGDGAVNQKLPDESMGFFDMAIRNRAMEMVTAQFNSNRNF